MTKIASQKSLMKKAALATAMFAATAGVASAASNTGDEGFGTLFEIFNSWIGGNLGKLLALIGFAGTFVVYMMTHKGSVLMIGIIISLLAGGMVGISATFWSAGRSSFGAGSFTS